MTETATPRAASPTLERHTMPDGSAVLLLPPRGARRIMWAEPSSLLIVAGMCGVSFWAAWYARYPTVNWLGVAFALLLAAAFVRSGLFVRADRNGTRVQVSLNALVIEDLGQRHAWQSEQILHVSAGPSAHAGPRLLVRTIDGLEEVVRFRAFPELRALASEIEALGVGAAVVDRAQAAAHERQGGVLEYSSHPPSNRAAVAHGADGETMIFLRPRAPWRRALELVPPIMLVATIFVVTIVVDARPGSSRQVLVATLVGVILLLSVIALVMQFTRRSARGTAVRIERSKLWVTVGTHERHWPWAQIADVGVGPDPSDDSGKPCLLVRLDDRIVATLQGEDLAELEWVAGIIRSDRPRGARYD